MVRVSTWDGLKPALASLRDRHPEAFRAYPDTRVDEGRPPFHIVLAARAVDIAADLHKQFAMTYAQAWPSREGAFADKINHGRKYVVSSTLTDPTWQTTTVISDNVPDEIARLKKETGVRFWSRAAAPWSGLFWPTTSLTNCG